MPRCKLKERIADKQFREERRISLIDVAEGIGIGRIMPPTASYATAELDPVTASLHFSQIMSELGELFSANPNTIVQIRVAIAAEDGRGFTERTVRAA